MTEPDDHQLMGITEISQLYFPGINLGRVSSVAGNMTIVQENCQQVYDASA
jgi:hypothetical protein